MIKLLNKTNVKGNPIAEVINQQEVVGLLRDMGVDLVKDGKSDAVFQLENEVVGESPTIIYEKVDGAYLKSSTRKTLRQYPNVVGVMKNYKYASHEINNVDCIEHRPYTRYFSDTGDKCEARVKPSEWRKCHEAISFLHYLRMDQSICKHPQKKQVDVFFAGTTDYTGKVKSSDYSPTAGMILRDHRLKALSVIEECAKKHKIRAKITYGRLLSRNIYTDLMGMSKLTVSPFGWGEPCYREYEAMINGVLPIKPRHDEILSFPSVYNDKHMLYCSVNFDDLEDKIIEGLDAWKDGEARREENRLEMIEHRKLAKIAERLSQIIKKVLK